jgi:hypothetical protein
MTMFVRLGMQLDTVTLLLLAIGDVSCVNSDGGR